MKDTLTSVRGVRQAVPTSPGGNIDNGVFAELPHIPLPSGKPRTLRIQWELSKIPSRDDEGIWGLTLFQLYFAPYISDGCRMTDLRFLNLANVTSYEIQECSYYGLDQAFGGNCLATGLQSNRGLLRWLAQLETLSLGFSVIDPEKVGQLLAACSNLKKLTWDPFSILVSDSRAHSIFCAPVLGT